MQTIVGLFLYYVLISVTAYQCKKKQLESARSFVVGAVSGFGFLALICLIGYVSSGKFPLANDSILLTVVIALALMVLAGFRCMQQSQQE